MKWRTLWVSANHKTFFKIVQAFKRHMSIRMRAFAYMKTKIFLQSEGLTGGMGRGCYCKITGCKW